MTAGERASETAGVRLLQDTASITGAAPTCGQVAVLRDGDATLAALLEALAHAQTSIALSAHVFWGTTARDVADALSARARDGLPCFVLLDGLESMKTDRAVLGGMRRAGVAVVRARVPWRHPLQLNRRVHRNVAVVDARTAIVGGVGIGDDWRASRCERPFRDRALLLRGAVARELLGTFLDEWVDATGAFPGALLADARRRPDDVAGGVPLLVIRSRAGSGLSPLERTLRLAVASAHRSVDVSTAYFVPPPGLRTALAAARRRGVRVRVLVAGRHSNRPVARSAGRWHYEPLLQAGVEIHEYEPAMLHAKTLVVDEALAAVGSANVDNRSLVLDDEVVVLAAAGGLARVLTDAFEEDLARSERLSPERWARRPRRQRVVERAAALIRRDL